MLMRTSLLRTLVLAMAVAFSEASSGDASCLAGEACSAAEVELAEDGMDAEVMLLQLKEGAALKEDVVKAKVAVATDVEGGKVNAVAQKWFWNRRRAAQSSESSSSSAASSSTPSWCKNVPADQLDQVPACKGQGGAPAPSG
mmetsp:Transcript_27357/g.62257  ORF Transcript_27357/g.62257 Transcript_27357/m.62257 type:complete len:142 (-) Transcript_27357:79-504(-)